MLVAIVNGVFFSKTIKACDLFIDGPVNVCPSAVYQLNSGLATFWYVTSGFTVTSQNATSATVKSTGCNNQSGTLTAVVNGNNITKSIQASAPYVSGPDFLCWQSSATFTLEDAPAGYTIMWTGNNMTPANNNPGTSMVFTAPTIYGGWVVANILDTNNYPIVQIPKYVKGDKVQSIGGPSSIPEGGYGSYGANMTCPGIPTLTWTLQMEGGFYVSQTTTNQIPINVYSNRQSILKPNLRTTWYLTVDGVTKKITAEGDAILKFTQGRGETSHYIVYPNPVSDILYVEINQEAIDWVKALEQTTDRKSLQDPTFDIRLYDHQGNMKRRASSKGGIVEFNVSNLPIGVYYLHIYDGVSETPEIRQIIVEH
jgi:hypothetical protein